MMDSTRETVHTYSRYGIANFFLSSLTWFYFSLIAYWTG